MDRRSLRSFMRAQRVGRMATVDARNRPVIVPLCFVYDGEAFYSALDEKPKKVGPEQLARTRNIRANPDVALVVDHYEEDWLELRFVLVRGKATVLFAGKEHTRALGMLRRKYPQYRKMNLAGRPILRIVPWKIVSWSAKKGTSQFSR
jgi:PPOX class probable F420-dependent enzyme